VTVITGGSDFEAVYQAWSGLHLAEILEMVLPDFESMAIYRRYLKSASMYLNISGKADEEMIIRKSQNPEIMFSRKNVSHTGNVHIRYFCEIYSHIME
jgi:hypothetical protein